MTAMAMGIQARLRDWLFGSHRPSKRSTAPSLESVKRAAEELSRTTVEVRTKINNINAMSDDPWGLMVHSMRSARMHHQIEREMEQDENLRRAMKDVEQRR